MAQKNYTGVSVELNEEGYFLDPKVWTKEMAIEIAKELDLELSGLHFEVLNYLRMRFNAGEALTIRGVGKSGVVDIKGFYGLFPGAPMKKAAKIAGIPKPASCI